MGRLNRVLDAQQAFPVEGTGQDPAVGLQIRGHVVGDFGKQAGRLGVGDQHLDRLDFAERKRLG